MTASQSAIGTTHTAVRARGRRTSGPSAARVRLMDAVNQHLMSDSRLPSIVEQIVHTAQTALDAEASSVLLLNDIGTKLYFQVAEGDKAQELKTVIVDTQSGIAGWVARHNESAVVNDVASDTRFTGDIDRTVGFRTRSVICVPLSIQGKLIGVLEVLNKLTAAGFTNYDLASLHAVAGPAALAIESTRLQHQVEEGYKATMRSLAAAVDAKDPYTRGHSLRVMQYSLMAGLALHLSPDQLNVLEQGAILHDVGKIGVDDRILRKPARLTKAERLQMEDHPAIGAAIVEDIPFLREARKLILHHHERWDGSGYPNQLCGDQIPFGASVLAVADAFDTMTTDRPYRKAMPFGAAMREFERCSGTQFCPEAVEGFIAGLRDHSAAAESAAEQLLGVAEPPCGRTCAV